MRGARGRFALKQPSKGIETNSAIAGGDIRVNCDLPLDMTRVELKTFAGGFRSPDKVEVHT